MKIRQVTVTRFRGWRGPVIWQPGTHAVLVGPNSGGKSSLLAAVDLVLNPHRNSYRERLGRHDFFDLDLTRPVEIEVILDHLDQTDCDVFEPYLEGQRQDGSFMPADSPEEEFDEGTLVLRLALSSEVDAVARSYFARPDANGATVHQDHKVRIGWQLVPAGLDPLRELAFYSNSVFAKLFERVDLSAELAQIRTGIETAKSGLMNEPHVRDTRERLEQAASQLGLTQGSDPLDFEVLDMSDRRVLQSLQLVLRGRRSNERLPLRAHGAGALRTLLLAAVLQQVRVDGTNLILAVEEPEQNLEPVNQRLAVRTMLLEESAGVAQVILSTHSPTVASVVPLDDLHLVRQFASGPGIRALGQTPAAQRKLFERHADTPLVGGLYADLVVLVEGPSELGALPHLWAKAHPGAALDERRIEVLECGGSTRLADYAAFFSQLAIPVAVVCDCDPGKSDERQASLTSGAGLLVHWKTHADWEGVLCAEADLDEVLGAMDEVLADFGTWAEHASRYVAFVRAEVGDAPHLASATGLKSLLAGYDDVTRRAVTASLLRRRQLGFKSARPHRLIAQALSEVPPTIKQMMELIHRYQSGLEHGEHGL